MAAIRTTANLIVSGMLHRWPLSSSFSLLSVSKALPDSCLTPAYTRHRRISFVGIRCSASDSGKKVSSRLSQVQQLLQEAEERASSAGNEPIPKITLGILSLLGICKSLLNT